MPGFGVVAAMLTESAHLHDGVMVCYSFNGKILNGFFLVSDGTTTLTATVVSSLAGPVPLGSNNHLWFAHRRTQ